MSTGLRGRFATAHVIVVAAEKCALIYAIRRMGVGSVSHVASMEAAQLLCDQGSVDACLIVLPKAVPDEQPPWTAETPAPGQGRLPALVLADPVTPYIKASARAAGYAAAIPLGLSSRLLYRAVAALLQGRRAGLPRQIAGISSTRFGGDVANLGKPRLQ